MGVLSAIDCGAAKGIIGVMLIQPVILIQNRYSRCFQRRNASEKIPQTFKMVFHFTSASHDIAAAGIKDAVAGSSGNIHCLKNMNMRAGHLAVAYQEAGSGKRSKTTSYNVGIFMVNAFRLFRTGKGFVVSVAVIDSFAVFSYFPRSVFR